LVLNDSTHRAKEIDSKIDVGQKFSSKLWLCAVIAARILRGVGTVPNDGFLEDSQFWHSTGFFTI